MSITDSLRDRVARRLERGDATALAGAAAAVWAALGARGLGRPLALPRGARVIGVGSAVLGGAGKTPLAIAIARALAARGERVALVGHAYRADPGRARLVGPADRHAEVGDDALVAARLLAGSGAGVVVAPRRQLAVDHAVALGFHTLVIDGLLQAAPRRLDAAILALDAAAPWGAGACPPAGDLRAPPGALLAAADLVALLGEGAAPADAPSGSLLVPSFIAGARDDDGASRSLDELAGARVGLILAIARPHRIEAALRRAGVAPAVILALADHAVPSPRDLAAARRAGVDLWLTTARCAVKLPPAIGGAPVLALDHRVDAAALVARL